jgi:hypothetical protein
MKESAPQDWREYGLLPAWECISLITASVGYRLSVNSSRPHWPDLQQAPKPLKFMA